MILECFIVYIEYACPFLLFEILIWYFKNQTDSYQRVKFSYMHTSKKNPSESAFSYSFGFLLLDVVDCKVSNCVSKMASYNGYVVLLLKTTIFSKPCTFLQMCCRAKAFSKEDIWVVEMVEEMLVNVSWGFECLSQTFKAVVSYLEMNTFEFVW